MKKAISAAVCAALTFLAFSLPASAKISVDSQFTTGVSGEEGDALSFWQSAGLWFRNALLAVQSFWKAHAVLIIALLVIAAMLAAVAVLSIEDEKRRKREIAQKHPESDKRKK